MDIEKLLRQMTLEEKLCQMTQTTSLCVYRDEKEKCGEFSVMNLTDKQYDSLGSVLAYKSSFGAKGVQDEHLKNDRNQIPLLIMMDVIHGWKTEYPVPLAMGATFNLDLIEECCKATAEEAVQDGVMVTFSPMVDLSRDARWGRVMETNSEDPYLNGEFGKAMIRGYHAGGLACCVKHFAAYGGAESGKDYNLVDMSEHTLREYYLRPYQECMKENPELVMTSFNSLNGIPSIANKHLMLDILRGEWEYDGVVISDYAAVNELIRHRCKPNGKEAAKAAISTTADIEMCTPHFAHYGEELVRSGELDEKIIDDSVRRILRLKEKLGLFENPYYKLAKEGTSVTEKSRDIARRVAEETFVLLKNEDVLPLRKEEKIALIGPFADTKEIVGGWSVFCDREATIPVKVGMEKLAEKEIPCAKACHDRWNSSDESGFDEAIETAKRADKVILCIGEAQSESGECKSKTDIRLPKIQRKLVREIRKLGKPVVAVIFAGRPLVLTEEIDSFDGVLYVWHPGTEGGNAIANVLYGKVNPSGKLPVSLPRSVGQCPLYYNSFSTGRPAPFDAVIVNGTSCYIDELTLPLFPFGFGLSYTKFQLSAPCVTSSVIRKGESLQVRTKIKNVGSVAGAETVQLYIRDDFSELVRPVKELKGFQKVFLEPNEEKEISFEITEEMLSYYGVDDVFGAEKGTFTISVGTSSVDLQSVSIELV